MEEGEVYYFDEVYNSCSFNMLEKDTKNEELDYIRRHCNNGYTCNSKDNHEYCEENPMISKCYSFSCPLVSDGASVDEIRESKLFDLDDIEICQYDDDMVSETNEVCVWLGVESSYISTCDVVSNALVTNAAYSFLYRKPNNKNVFSYLNRKFKNKRFNDPVLSQECFDSFKRIVLKRKVKFKKGQRYC